jgi:hypothetical protein
MTFNKTLIGSRAILHHYPDYSTVKTPKDFDYLVWPKEDSLVPKHETNEDGRHEYYHLPVIEYSGLDVIDMDTLYTIKLSHVIRPINSTKHLKDLVFLKSKGHKSSPELLDKLLKFWESYHGPRRSPDFNKLNEDFFADKVDRQYNHDDLHELVKYKERPMFTYIKHDQSKAEPVKELFDLLSEEDKHRVVLEEAYVIALERFVLKRQNKETGIFGSRKYPYTTAYHNAMSVLITRLFPDWLALYAADNYQSLIDALIDYTALVPESGGVQTEILI